VKRLLLVDDDRVVTQFYGNRLSAHGFLVNTAAGGAAALSFLRSVKPDLVVLDLMMPKVSGVDVLKHIRSEPKLAATPVVLLTNSYDNHLGRSAERIGIQKAFQKAQCSPSILRAAIHEIFETPTAAAGPREPENKNNEARRTCPEAGAAVLPDKLDTPADTESQTGFRGLMRRIGLQEVLQIECLGRRSSVLEVLAGTVRGRIYIDNGSIVHAESGDLEGEIPLYGLLALHGGEFNLLPFSEPPRRSIEGNWEFLVMEAARLSDEGTNFFSRSSPSDRMAAIDEILDPRMAAAGPPEPGDEPAMLPDTPPNEDSAAAAPDDMAQVGAEESRVEPPAGLLHEAPAICAGLAELFEDLAREARTGSLPQDQLTDLFCRVHRLAEAARGAEFAFVAQTTAVFAALLNKLMENPMPLGPSLLQTLGSLVEVVALLFQHARLPQGGTSPPARVLVVDDDPVANEAGVAALNRAGLTACSTDDPVVAWQRINSERFDQVVLNIEMPGFDALQLYGHLRMLPGYEKTPVIFLAAQDDLDTRATSALGGASDLMAKPILPQELAARVVTLLVRSQLSTAAVPHASTSQP